MEDQTQGQNLPTDQVPVEGGQDTPSDMPAENQVPDQLPENASDRTREQFEKLKEHNRLLAEENSQLKQSVPAKPSVLESYMPPAMGYTPPMEYTQVPLQSAPPQQGVPDVGQYQNLSPQEIESAVQGAIDPSSGLLDPAMLTRRLTEMNQYAARVMQQRRQQSEAEIRAKNAELKVQQVQQKLEQFEVTQAARELHQEFPELDPNNPAFSPEAYDLVKQKLLNQLVETGRQDGLGAAREMAKFFRTNKGPTLEQQKAQQNRAIAATTAGTGQRSTVSSDQDFEELKTRSRHDKDALAERLRMSGF